MKRTELATSDRVVLLLSVIPYLREHGPTPLTELATVFGVSPRLLRSLISFLGMAGVPGETATYQDEDLFDIDWQALEEQDLVSLTRTVAVEDTPRFSAIESAALLAGLLALRPMLPDTQLDTIDTLREKLQSASANGTVNATEAVSMSVAPDHVAPAVSDLLQALRDQRQVTFSYLDARGAQTERRVDPLLLQQTAEQWYLRAWCIDRAAERTFAVDRMIEVVVTGAPTAHDALPSTEFAVRAPESDETGVSVEVRVTERGAAAISGFAPERRTAADENGWITAVVQLAHPAVAVRLAQTLPGEVRIVSPASAVQAVADWAELALVAYDE